MSDATTDLAEHLRATHGVRPETVDLLASLEGVGGLERLHDVIRRRPHGPAASGRRGLDDLARLVVNR